MRIKKPKGFKKQKSLFKPDELVDKLQVGLNRDLGQPVLFRANPIATNYIKKHQPKSFLKKYKRSESVDSLELETYIKFMYVNEHMGKFNNSVKPSRAFISNLDGDVFSNVLLRARSIMREVLQDLDEEEWFTECRNSPGSSIGVSFVDTSLEKKFSLPISVTERAKPMFDRYLTFDYQLKASILNRSDLPLTGMYNVVQGSRATTVEKNNIIDRMICIEPTGNMYLQQGLMYLMYNKMKSVGLDVQRLPELHKRLAFESSITSRFATIDWSSASDCVSLELLRYLLPPKWFSAIEICRSESTEILGDSVRLNMFSTMGNADTFPLETLVFWTMAMSVVAEDTNSTSTLPNWEDRSKVSVFGDDCIVPSSSAPLFISIMEKVGFIINTDKSFIDDSGFRESCGGDFLHGFDVRPFCIKAPTSTSIGSLEPWLYIIFNSLKTKYISYFGELSYLYDKHVFKIIFDVFRRYNIRVKLVPDYFPDDSGLKTHGDFHRLSKHYSFNVSPVMADQHGSRTFRYCRFVYSNKQITVDDLRYAVWLKKPYITPMEVFSLEKAHTYKKRAKGGYVVAKTSTSFWSEDLTVAS